MYGQQISFASIAKTIMTMAFMSRRKQKLQNDLLSSVLQSLGFLQEFDIKVQQQQCLLQYTKRVNEVTSPKLQGSKFEDKNNLYNNTDKSEHTRNLNEIRSRSNSSYNDGNRPKSSSSVSKFNQSNQDPMMSMPLNSSGVDQQVKETIIIELSDQLFNNLSWAQAFDYLNQDGKQKDILGLIPMRSNLVWRYFLSLLKQR